MELEKDASAIISKEMLRFPELWTDSKRVNCKYVLLCGFSQFNIKISLLRMIFMDC
jgi:hypothetical protein